MDQDRQVVWNASSRRMDGQNLSSLPPSTCLAVPRLLVCEDNGVVAKVSYQSSILMNRPAAVVAVSTIAVMSSSHSYFTASKLCSILFLLPPVLCHMEMSWPYPFRSKYNPGEQLHQHRLQHDFAAQRERHQFPVQRLPKRRPGSAHRDLHCRLDV